MATIELSEALLRKAYDAYGQWHVAKYGKRPQNVTDDAVVVHLLTLGINAATNEAERLEDATARQERTE